jgi:TadE-like protein
MVEFVAVGPAITILGMAVLQYSLMFFAKNQINHAAFMAARAGSVAHATIDSIEAAYIRALIPLYGGGENSQELMASHAKVVADMRPDTLRVEVLNPTQESFDDFAKDPNLNALFNSRAIPNTAIAFRPDLDQVGPTSGQTLQDANLLKVRITHGYEPKVWLLGMIHSKYLSWMDTGRDKFVSQLIASGRIPMVTHVAIEMQSEALEQKDSNGRSLFVSNPGRGNEGSPVNPGDPDISNNTPPECLTMACTVSDKQDKQDGSDTNGSSDGSGKKKYCVGANCSICNG